MQIVAEALGNPQKRLSAIHVAGTNGKGSVCAMLEALYSDNGYKTGLFTSPHLIRLNERIQINRSPISDSDLIQYTAKLAQVSERLIANKQIEEAPSFFEFMTAMAFQYFCDQGVDIVIVETGLGGRLDATNILDPMLSIITSIGMDHTEILGDTLEKIAFEKAGIIKNDCPILIGDLPPIAESEITEIALKKSAPLYTYKMRFENQPLPNTNLQGSFQSHNAGLALHASEILESKFPLRSTAALNHIEWEGRWQSIQLGKKTVIFDSTHNQEACKQLEENLKKLQMDTQKQCVFVSGIIGIDRAQAIVPIIAEYAKAIYFVAIDQPRACDTETLKSCLPNSYEGTVHTSELNTLFTQDACLIGEDSDLIVVSGSIYLIGAIMTVIQGLEADPIGQDIVKPNP